MEPAQIHCPRIPNDRLLYIVCFLFRRRRRHEASALCIFAALVLITLIRFANRSTFNLSDEAFPRRAFGANGSANRNVLPLLIVAIGGTALAPSLFGVFELVSWDVPELFVYREAASFVGNIAAPLLFVCAYMFGKEIGVDASFFFVAFASFVLVVSSAINSELIFLPVLFSRVLTVFFHVACWLFCFKAAKSEQAPLSAGLLMGLTDAVSWMGRYWEMQLSSSSSEALTKRFRMDKSRFAQ